MITESQALNILRDLENYKFTSEDVGSKKKSKNYLKLAKRCFTSAKNVESLSYLNKAMVNRSECHLIIGQYLELAINEKLYIEFFEFLKQGYENDLQDYFFEFEHIIERGFINFLASLSIYSFFNLLRIVDSMDFVFKFKKMDFLSHLVENFKTLMSSSNFNEKYFSIFFIEKHKEVLVKHNQEFQNIPSMLQLESLKKEILSHFTDEIDNFCLIEKLKLMKKQFAFIQIQEEDYLEKYKLYKKEVKELEKKVYLKKFAFLLFFIEKYGIKKSIGEFRKKRNIFTVIHDERNLKNPVYNYILRRIGFYGFQNQIVKSSDIGINFFLMTTLFLDDFNVFPDVFYYKNQFWGEDESYKIDKIKARSFLTKKIDYSYDIHDKYSSIDDIFIIEWDLANKPLKGSLVNAYGSQIIIPDSNNPLFHDLKPFDLCYCDKNPTKIEGNLIKNINIIAKCSFRDAIISVSKGMDFIEGFYPLSLIKSILKKEINPFEAHDLVFNNLNKNFVPNYDHFIKEFKKFVFQFIKQEKDFVFKEIKKEPKKRVNQIIFLLDLKHEIEGMNLPYSTFLENLFNEEINFGEFKTRFLEKIHEYIQYLLDKADSGSTLVFNLKRMQYTQFSKYSLKIIGLRKVEFESKKVIKRQERFDISEFADTYYGKKFMQILNLDSTSMVRPDLFEKLMEFSKKMKLKLNIINVSGS